MKKIAYCPNCYKKPPMFTKREWLWKHLESAFDAMWAANYGIDTKDEAAALQELIELIRLADI